MVKAIPEESVSERIVEQIARSVLVDRIKDQIAEHMAGIPARPVMEQIVAVVQEVVRLVPQERVQRINEQLVAVSESICEQIVHVPVPQVGVQEMTSATEALQFQVLANSNEMQGGSNLAMKSFLTKKHGLKM